MKRLYKIIILLTAATLLVGCNKNEVLSTEINNETEANNTELENKLNIENNSQVEEIEEVTKVDSEIIEQEIVEPEIIEPVYITLSFAGDCTLGGYKGQGAGNQFKDYFNEYGAEYFFSDVKSVFENDDLTLVNLEGPLTDYEQTANKEFPIKGEKEYVNILLEGPVEVANLANNHSYDCGQAGFDETKSLLLENNIGVIGEGNKFVTEIKGVKVGMLGYKIFNITDELKNTIKNDIENFKDEGVQIICVMTHGGTPERVYESNSTQESISHYIVDCGADIVVGGHPHVIQGIEYYNDKVICYSLGNFSFGANKNPSDKDTFIYQQTFKIENNEINTVEYNVIPCRISSETNKNNYQPMLLINEEHDKVIDRLRKYSEKYEVSIFDNQGVNNE